MEIHTKERPPIPSRRIWLDATQDAVGESRSTTPPPPIPSVPVPAIPAEHTAALQTHHPKRKSAPPGRLRTKVDNAAASPQVISSLLDSFSTFNPPPDPVHHGTSPRLSATKSMPVTPVLKQRSSFGHGPASERASLTDYELYRQQLADEFEEPEAAEPPVVRTSKRPSGKSEWTAPKLSHDSGLTSYVRGFGRSASSLSLQRTDDDSRSIGNVSVESTVRRRSLISISRESLEHRLGRKKSHSRVISPTREDFGTVDQEPTRELVLNATGVPEHLTPPTSPRRRTTPFDSVIQEEPPSPTSTAYHTSQESAVKQGKKPVHVDPINGPTVPNRRSSLRHSDIPSASKNRHSRELSALQVAADALAEEAHEPQAKVMLSELDGEPTEVTKRIKDLKAKKEQREREARASLSPGPEARTQRSRSVSPQVASTPSFESGPPSRQAKAAEKRSRIAQLGAINVPPRAHSGSTTPARSGQDGTSSPGLNVPQQPGTPLTPTNLPINYSYVVNSLSKRDSMPNLPHTQGPSSAAPPPPIPTGEKPNPTPAGQEPSTLATVTPNNNETTSIDAPSTSGASPAESLRDGKRKPISVGGRSAVGRAVSAKALPDLPIGPNVGTSRMSSPEPGDDRSSIDTSHKSEKASRSNSLRLKRRRWSQPEIPTPERSNSMKRFEPLAVQPPRPEKIVEERPGSADSIDADVKKFINHPRLSQKIRHPQSGRTIAFSEVGDPKGHAVFCCVGMGLTRYVTAFYDELAMTLGLRLITPDRPGVGGSPPDPNALPLTWPDDVLAICQALRISKFSIMAHSAGAIYALATALRMPQHIRGRVHLLAPWIPPSQMAPIGLTKQDPPPAAQLPKSQRFLRAMPTPFLKIANTAFLSAASASLSPNATGSPRRERRRRSDRHKREVEKESSDISRNDSKTENSNSSRPSAHNRRESLMLMDQQHMPDGSALEYAKSQRDLRSAYGSAESAKIAEQQQQQLSIEEENERREIYDSRLTLSIWALATTNANPAVDLLVCLERQRDIGFMYKDITRSVVIHHGSKDTRVPVENVKWLGRTMRKCEVRVLEGEGHGLMASAAVMGSVLEEMGREWREWDNVVKRTGNVRR
ncbi:uncharacterized protein PV09_05586 [Verruconis gallopava]|uniref:AB hydrolase-1 domain-containing protein n=1 Tax=Verruconis gallopava TaxID=253628 RepID=A0A0D2A9E8_9PEZI|nr:uncharacterized protein PV09_05586 [Verruconis gallopava]KIW03378.1 hypothetical protein PV09_05586 [Verruconis gallopava]